MKKIALTAARPAGRFCALATFALLAIIGQQQAARAQWTQPTGGSTVYKTDTGGNVGIGTNAPAAKLDLTFDGQNEHGLRVYDTRPGAAGNGGHLLFFGNSGGAATAARFGQIGGFKENATAGNMLGFLGFYTNDGATASSAVERMRISSAGYVGIGTSTPGASLHVLTASVAAGSRGIINEQISNDGNGSLLIFRKSRAGAAVQTGDAVGNLYPHAFDGTSYINSSRLRFTVDGPVSAGTVPTAIQFLTGVLNNGGAERMRITSEGNVGIGTPSPLGVLHVPQGAVFLGQNAAPGAVLRVGRVDAVLNGMVSATNYSDGARPVFQARSFSAGSLTGDGVYTFLAKDDSQVRTFSADHLGNGFFAGSVNAAGGLCINGSCKTSWAEVGSQWAAAAGTSIHFSAGSVGVGTSSPDSKLHVVGPTTGNGPTIHADGGGDVVLASGGGIFFDNNYNYGAGNYIRPVGANTQGFFTSGQERVRITPAGNVGIGTTTPTRKLVVSDSAASTLVSVENTAAAVKTFVQSNSVGFGAVGTETEHPLYFTTNNSTKLAVLANGNVGVGMMTPAAKLEVTGGYFRALDNGTNVPPASGRGAELIATGGVGYLQSYNRDAVAFQRLEISASPTTFSNGNVGIGTATPNASYKLDVNGAANVSGALNVTGAITGGSIQARYQDVAEWVPSVQKLAPGTVVILDPARANHVLASASSYDTAVAGVVSAQPGLILGEGGEGKVMVATTGRVRVRVDASKGAIKIGDLLVTSDVEGVAMRSEPVAFGSRRMHAPGTIIGKALEPLEKGAGEILVLLSMQ